MKLRFSSMSIPHENRKWQVLENTLSDQLLYKYEEGVTLNNEKGD